LNFFFRGLSKLTEIGKSNALHPAGLPLGPAGFILSYIRLLFMF
jgi:hypothetical protein